MQLFFHTCSGYQITVKGEKSTLIRDFELLFVWRLIKATFYSVWWKLVKFLCVKTEVSASILTDLIDSALVLFIGILAFCKEGGEDFLRTSSLILSLTLSIIFKLQGIGGVLRGFYILMITYRTHFCFLFLFFCFVFLIQLKLMHLV